MIAMLMPIARILEGVLRVLADLDILGVEKMGTVKVS